VTTPLVALLAVPALLLWVRARRRRRPVPGGPIIHRDLLEQAEREVRGLPASARSGEEVLGWGPGSPRSPIHL
jgi:hypothetical protein